MSKQPTWEQIANDRDAQCSYLLRRCLWAEGHDPDDAEAMATLIADAECNARA